jgi:hypothetical protein
MSPQSTTFVPANGGLEVPDQPRGCVLIPDLDAAEE